MKSGLAKWFALAGLAGAMCLACVYSGAAATTEAWSQRYNGAENFTDNASAVVVDESNNVYVAGTGSEAYPSTSCVIIAYSSAGVPRWTNYFKGGYTDTTLGLVMAKDGTLCLIDTFTGLSYGVDGYAIVAYSSSGGPLWTNLVLSATNTGFGLSAVTSDQRNGNIYLTGTLDLFNGGSSGGVYLTIGYTNNGTAIWTNFYSGPATNSDGASAIAVDSATGNVCVTGGSLGLDSRQDYLTIAYSASGVPLWTNRYNGYANDEDLADAIAADGNVYVTGYSYDYAGYAVTTIAYSTSGMALWTNASVSTMEPSFGPARISAGQNGLVYVAGLPGQNFGTVAYSSEGIPLWTNIYAGPNGGIDQPTAMAVDRCGNVYVTGTSSLGYATVAYTGAGLPLWTNRFDGPNGSYNEANAIALDGVGDVYVTGSTTPDGSSADWLTIKYTLFPQLNAFWSPTNGFQISFEGSCNASYAIETSTNLVNWNVASNVVYSNSFIHFTAPKPTNDVKRFFRVTRGD